jgi:hypothetical protein
MEYWEICEKTVRNLTGGRRTPGSGNKSIKGDVIVPGYTIEVKSTIKQEINLEYNWLVKLEKEYPKTTPLLVVFFGDGDYYIWMLNNRHDSKPDWITKKIDPDNIPETLIGVDYFWELQERDILKEL